MKHGKKLLSLLLALVMLCGLVQIPVSAVGTERSEQLKLIGIMPIAGDVLSGTNLSTNTSWYDKGMLIFFNQPTSIQRLIVRGRIVVVDENNDVVTYNGTKLVWQTGNRYTWMPDGTSNLYGLYGHFLTLSNNVKINNVTYDTWTSIAELLTETPELANYKLQFRLTDNNSGIDKYVNNVYVDDKTTTYLVADLAVANGDVPTTGGSYDCASIDFGVAVPEEGDRAAYIQPSSIVTLDKVTMNTNTDMTLTFSQSVTIDTNRNTAVLEIINPSGQALSTTYPVTLTTGNSKNVSASLSTTLWTTIRTALANAGEGSYVRFKMTEKNIETTRGELNSNYAVDTVWGTNTDAPLRASNTTASASTADYVLCNVTEDIPEVCSAVLQDANADTVKMLVTFNKPVTVNAKNNDVWLRFGLYSNGNGQLQMANKEYMNGYSIGDKTYSNQILFSFANTNKPLNGDVGILFAEYNYHNGAHEDYQVDGCVIADENGFGLLPTHVTSCSNANCTNQKVSLSYTMATLAEDAADIVSISRVDDTTVTVKFAMNVAGIDTAKGITLGGRTVTAAEGNADTWTLTLDGALTGADKELTIPANAVTTGYNGAVVGKVMTATLSMTDRIASAKEGETVALESDLTVDELAIAEGVTLDLNGHTLTAGSVATITSTSAIIDSKNGEGGIAVAKDSLLFVGTNAQLPLYDNGVYRFFDCEMVHMQRAGQTSDSVMFGVRMELNDRAYALLEDSVASGAELTLQLTSSAFDQPITYAFSADIVTEYAKNMQNNEGYWVIVLTVYGLDVLDEGTELTVTPLLHSSTSVTMTGEALTYTK